MAFGLRNERSGSEGRRGDRPHLAARLQRRDREDIMATRRKLGVAGLAMDIEETIASGRLKLYAQPIVDMETGKLVVEELLLRVQSPDGKISGPVDFLAAAERCGTIAEVDRWVFDQAVQIAAEGRGVTVNVSATTVSTPAFLDQVEQTLARYDLDPELITFEITETAVAGDIEQVSRFAERLDQIGCHFALDDFGTGYAALIYLKHLPVHYLKIDIDFVRDLSQNPRSRGVVIAVVALAEQLGHETIAEGVEDPRTFELLRELGVNLAQGFGIGRPTPVS